MQWCKSVELRRFAAKPKCMRLWWVRFFLSSGFLNLSVMNLLVSTQIPSILQFSVYFVRLLSCFDGLWIKFIILSYIYRNQLTRLWISVLFAACSDRTAFGLFRLSWDKVLFLKVFLKSFWKQRLDSLAEIVKIAACFKESLNDFFFN